MDAAEVCKAIAEQFDHTTQGHLAILGTIAVNVIMLIRVWITSRNTGIQVNQNAEAIKGVQRTINGS